MKGRKKWAGQEGREAGRKRKRGGGRVRGEPHLWPPDRKTDE
jgi:hypothetical protein